MGPALTQDVSFNGLILKTAPLSPLTRSKWYWGLILTCEFPHGKSKLKGLISYFFYNRTSHQIFIENTDNHIVSLRVSTLHVFKNHQLKDLLTHPTQTQSWPTANIALDLWSCRLVLCRSLADVRYIWCIESTKCRLKVTFFSPMEFKAC